MAQTGSMSQNGSTARRFCVSPSESMTQKIPCHKWLHGTNGSMAQKVLWHQKGSMAQKVPWHQKGSKAQNGYMAQMVPWHKRFLDIKRVPLSCLVRKLFYGTIWFYGTNGFTAKLFHNIKIVPWFYSITHLATKRFFFQFSHKWGHEKKGRKVNKLFKRKKKR